MPQSKRQKPLHDSGVFVDDSDESDSGTHLPHKSPSRGALAETSGNDRQSTAEPKSSKKKNDAIDANGTPPPHKYMCMYRPFFDYDGANWRDWTDNGAKRLESNEIHTKLYVPGIEREDENGIFKGLPEQHKDHKWVIMWDAWLKYDLLKRKGNYCDPDNFSMYICNDWRGWGMQEIVENMMVDFDRAFKKKDDSRIDEMWAVISAVGLWLNCDEICGALIGNEDGEKTREQFGLLGCALLTVLHAIESAGELKPDSRFLDLTLVIGYYFELSHDLPAYGIEGKCMAWRQDAIAYFESGGLDAKKSLFATDLRIEKLKNASGEDEDDEDEDEDDDGNKTPKKTGSASSSSKKNDKSDNNKKVSPPPTMKTKKASPAKGNVKDKWSWATTFKAYKRQHGKAGGKIGGQHYDITKMSKADRAAAAFDGKDPLADVPAKALKENLLDFA